MMDFKMDPVNDGKNKFKGDHTGHGNTRANALEQGVLRK